MLTRGDFISKLTRIYPSAFRNKDTCSEIMQEYRDVLIAPFEIDFNKLWELIRQEWSYPKTPDTAWLYERLPKCKFYYSYAQKDVEDRWVIPPGYDHPILFGDIPKTMGNAELIKNLVKQREIIISGGI